MAGVKPGADAVMVTDPSLIPLTTSCGVEKVVPAATKMLGITVAIDASLLASEMVTPPAGAGVDKVTWSATD